MATTTTTMVMMRKPDLRSFCRYLNYCTPRYILYPREFVGVPGCTCDDEGRTKVVNQREVVQKTEVTKDH